MKLRLLPRADVILVEVSVEGFAFHTPRQTLSVPTAIMADPKVDRRDPVLRRARLPSAPVRLFGPDHHTGEPLAKPRLLAAYLRRVLLACVDDRFLKLSPHLIFRRAESLDRCLLGYQYEILAQAAFVAGARSVRFESTCPLPREYAGQLHPARAS